MGEEITAGVLPLWKVLCEQDMFYSIPEYQRPYAWEQEQISQLIGDLREAFCERHDERYFCGSVVLTKSASDDRFDVIDGQQRLTTFVIMCCVLRDFFATRLNGRASHFVAEAIRDRDDEDKLKLRLYTDDSAQIDFAQKVATRIDFEACTANMPNASSSERYVYKAFGNDRYLTNA